MFWVLVFACYVICQWKCSSLKFIWIWLSLTNCFGELNNSWWQTVYYISSLRFAPSFFYKLAFQNQEPWFDSQLCSWNRDLEICHLTIWFQTKNSDAALTVCIYFCLSVHFGIINTIISNRRPVQLNLLQKGLIRKIWFSGQLEETVASSRCRFRRSSYLPVIFTRKPFPFGIIHFRLLSMVVWRWLQIGHRAIIF